MIADSDLNDEFAGLMNGLTTAFSLVRENRVAEISRLGLPLWDMVLIKTLYLYYPEEFLSVGNKKVIEQCAHDLQLPVNDDLTHLNWLCRAHLKRIPELRTWPNEYFGAFIWKLYDPTASSEENVFNSDSPKYWVFQANPRFYDLEDGLRSKLIDNWTVSAHKDKIKVGDKVILWSTGPRSGCYALATVTEPPRKISDLPDAHLWKVEDPSLFKAGIEVTHDLVENPILKDIVAFTPGLKDLKAGNQGTNFTATKDEYEILRLMAEKQTGAKPQVKLQMQHSLNRILYGPPGTGKTYNSIIEAVKVVDGELPTEHPEIKKRFDELRGLGQIEFVTFHQNYSYEDFMIGVRPDLTESAVLKFVKNEGVFYRICKTARENYLKSDNNRTTKYVSFEEVLEEFLRDFPATKPEFGDRSKYYVYDADETRLYFETTDGKKESWQRLVLPRLKEYFQNTFTFKGGYHLYYSQINEKFHKIKERLEQGASNEVSARNNYVLIIDEINRANISRVFGELITLLEEDKRLGEENELRVTLPNGERDFGIPPNLYVLGTMNTADKSIALIDIALRRRFEFIHYRPDLDKVNDPEKKKLLTELNSKIYEKKKSPDYLIGHAYFMGQKSIPELLQNKIIPLLTEYFAGKTEVVSEVFSKTDWNVAYDTTKFGWEIARKQNDNVV